MFSQAHTKDSGMRTITARYAKRLDRFLTMPKSLLRSNAIMVAAVSLTAFSLPAQSSPSLSAAERAIVGAVDARKDEALALLERIVNINSGTMNFAGVRQVADVLRPQLEGLGFTTRWVDGAP